MEALVSYDEESALISGTGITIITMAVIQAFQTITIAIVGTF
jgi:hypothetical protein